MQLKGSGKVEWNNRTNSDLALIIIMHSQSESTKIISGLINHIYGVRERSQESDSVVVQYEREASESLDCCNEKEKESEMNDVREHSEGPEEVKLVVPFEIKEQGMTFKLDGLKITIANECCLPANSILIVSINTEKIGRELQVLCPSLELQLKEGIIIAPGLFDSSTLSVLIYNLTDTIVSLPAQTCVGICKPAKLCEDEDVKPSNIAALSMNNKPKFDPTLFNINPEAPAETKTELLSILEEFWDFFALNNSQLGCTNIVKHKIDTRDPPPIRQRLWNEYSREENEIIADQVKSMLECGVITRGYSPWCSNVVLAYEKKLERFNSVPMIVG